MTGFLEVFQGRSHSGVDSQLPVDSVKVGLNGVFGHAEAAGNLFVTVTIDEKSQNLLLPLTELARGRFFPRRLPSPELADNARSHTMAHPDFAFCDNHQRLLQHVRVRSL